MRKVIILLAILAVGMTATAQDVKIKRGKVTMSEADYNVLKQKADLYEKTQKVLDETLAAYQKQQQMNDMYRPIVLKDFNDSASYAIGKDIYQSWLQGGDSDYSSFNRNGYAAVHTFENTHHSSPFIHTPDDILGVSVNSMDQAKRFTELNVGLVATLAGLVSTGVDDVTDERLVVYPNPVSETLTVKGVSIRRMEVFNTLGQRVLNNTCHGDEIHLDVSSLAAGVYMLRVIDDAMQVHTHRIITY